MVIPLLLLLSGYFHEHIFKIVFELTLCMEHYFFGVNAISYYENNSRIIG